MSTWKSATNAAAKPKVESDALDDLDNVANPPQRVRVEAASLRIDDDFDPGSDPYNQTGQFCVADMKDALSD